LEVPVAELLVARGLNLNAVDGNGRNELHTALAPPTVPLIEGIEYLIGAGVRLNECDRSGKTRLPIGASLGITNAIGSLCG
jgi:hypothetical protein